MSETKWTKGPWEFRRFEGFDDLHKLNGTQPEEHEGYFRGNDGSWAVGFSEGRVCTVDFCGKAKRGQGYLAPDPQGQANAHLIAAAPSMAEYIRKRMESGDAEAAELWRRANGNS